MIQFSVVIPCFNAAKTLSETLASIREQTNPHLEIICVDDDSSDETCTLIEIAAKHDPRIRLVRNTTKGPSGARNTGIRCARGEIIAFCDADDIWAKGKLAVLDRAFRASDVAGFYGKIAFFSDSPKADDVRSTVADQPLTVPILLGENPVCTMSNIAVRRSFVQGSAGFDANIVHNEDLEWLIRLVGNGAKICGIDRTLVWYRATPTGLSADLHAMASGRQIAVRTAQTFGFTPSSRSEAIHFRYLARRALRLDMRGMASLNFCLRGLRKSPTGFLFPVRRGAATVAASLVAPFLPRSLRRVVFAS